MSMADKDYFEQVVTLKDMINNSGYAVFFGGAGVSTESGIPDFRGSFGIYKNQYRYPAETIISAGFLESNPEYFFEFYREKLVYPNAKPNPAHVALAGLEAAGKLRAVITQNIDGLHQMVGSRTVIELHGSIHRNFCRDCGYKTALDFIMESPGVPLCPVCGGMVRPEVTLYGEELDSQVILAAIGHISQADLLIVGGTSLVVHPAAGLLGYFRGKRLVVINKTPTPLDERADLLIEGSIGEVFALMDTGGDSRV